MKVYKVMTIEDTGTELRLVSEVAEGKAKVVYQEGVKAVPPIPGSKLFVFVDKERALSYHGDLGPGEVWECEASEATPIAKVTGYWNYWQLERYWEGKADQENLMPAPFGAHGVDWLIPTKRIWPSE